MYGACSTRSTDEKCIQHFGRKILSEATIWERDKIREENIKVEIKGIVCEDVDWINLTQ
jgi:hypothetical protein